MQRLLSDRSLSAEQIATIVLWADEGAPEGEAADEGAALTPIEGMSRVDLTLTMSEPYTPLLEPDDYRCFLLEWTGGDAFVTGFSATPGNRSIVHHVIAYRVPADEVAGYEAMDAAEDGAGYTCFGGPGGSEGGGAAWLGGWVPGSTGADFPAGTGIAMEEGALIAMQIHYNTGTVGPQADQTAIQMKLDDNVDKQAAIVKVFDPRWLVPGGMTIAAGDADASHAFTYTNSSAQTFSLWSSGLHMHQLGSSASLTLDQAAGQDDCLVEISNWRFGWQGTYFFQEPVEFAPGDSATLTCNWDNSGAGAVDTEWGEGSTDEMCLAMVYTTMAD